MVARVRAVLDTSVIVASDVSPLEGDLAISAISLAELQFGVLVAKEPRIRAGGCGGSQYCSGALTPCRSMKR